MTTDVLPKARRSTPVTFAGQCRRVCSPFTGSPYPTSPTAGRIPAERKGTFGATCSPRSPYVALVGESPSLSRVPNTILSARPSPRCSFRPWSRPIQSEATWPRGYRPRQRHARSPASRSSTAHGAPADRAPSPAERGSTLSGARPQRTSGTPACAAPRSTGRGYEYLAWERRVRVRARFPAGYGWVEVSLRGDFESALQRVCGQSPPGLR